ncbi:hypothetical protein JCM11641_005123 [Rhodosporidiobolus odoratus]
MKAGAFGRTPQRRDVQPGGRVLPGMFTSSANSSSAPSASSTSSSKPAPADDSSAPLISSWGNGRGGSGRLPASSAPPSRLERLRSEKATESAGSSGRGAVAAAPLVESSDSISRARKLGLNRAPKREATPPPSSGEEEEPEEWFSSPRNGRTREASEPTVLPGTNHFNRAAAPVDAPVPRTETSAAAGGEDKPQQTLFGSLWGRAAQLVGGGAVAENTVKEVQHGRHDSGSVSDLAVPESKVTPFKLHEGEEEPHEHDAAEPTKEQSNLKNTRPIALPPLVARALSDPTNAIKQPRRPAVPALPPVEPITYHRPPALYPRDLVLAAPRTRYLHRTPYDWLEGRDEAPLDPYLFHRQPGRAATKKARGSRAARPAMPPVVRTDPGPAGGNALGMAEMGVAAGAGAAAMPEGLFRTLTSHPNMPPAGGHPLASPPIPSVPPPHHVVTGYQPLAQHGYGQPAVQPPYSHAAADPFFPAAMAAGAAPAGFAAASAYSVPGAPPHAMAAAMPGIGPEVYHLATGEPLAPAPYAAPPPPALSPEPSGLPSYEHTVEPSTFQAPEMGATSAPFPTSAPPAAAPHPLEEAFPRAGAGANSLPTFPAPAPSPVPQLPFSSAPPGFSAPPVSAPLSAPGQPPAPLSGSAVAPPPAAAGAAPSAPGPAPAAPAAPAPAAPHPASAPFQAASAPLPPSHPSAPAHPWQTHYYPPGHPYAGHPIPLPPHLSTSQPPMHPAAGTGSGAIGGLPAMPQPRLIPASPSPHPPSPQPPTSLPPGSTPASLYPAHLAALQPLPISPPVTMGGMGQQAWPFPPPSMPTPLPTPGPPTPFPCGDIPHAVPPAHGEVLPALGALAGGVAAQYVGEVGHQPAEGVQEGEAGEEDEAQDPDLPGYGTPAPQDAPTASSALALPASAALNTPLPASPAPSLFLTSDPSSSFRLPIEQSSSPVPAMSLPPLDGGIGGEDLSLPAYEAPPSAPVPTVTPRPLSADPARAPSLNISTVASPPPPAAAVANQADGLNVAEIVFTPPTPVSPRPMPGLGAAVGQDDGPTARQAYTSDAAETKEDEPEYEEPTPPIPGPVPAPALQPLELGWSLPDLGFGLDLGFESDAAVTPVQAQGAGGSGGSLLAAMGLEKVGTEVPIGSEGLPFPQRASSPAIEFGTEYEEGAFDLP